MNHQLINNQVLVDQPVTRDGQPQTETTLLVCVQGEDAFRREMADPKYEDQLRFHLPFSFIAVADTDTAPQGAFYELEYTTPDSNVVNRALLQAVNPVTDLPLIVGELRHHGLVLSDLTPYKAQLRDDIQVVNIVTCDADPQHRAFAGESIHRVGASSVSVFDTVIANHTPVAYRIIYCLADAKSSPESRVAECWFDHQDQCDLTPIFVSGSPNVFDPAFADIAKADLDELRDCLDRFTEIANEYSLQYFLCCTTGPERDGKTTTLSAHHCTPALFKAFADHLSRLAQK